MDTFYNKTTKKESSSVMVTPSSTSNNNNNNNNNNDKKRNVPKEQDQLIKMILQNKSSIPLPPPAEHKKKEENTTTMVYPSKTNDKTSNKNKNSTNNVTPIQIKKESSQKATNPSSLPAYSPFYPMNHSMVYTSPTKKWETGPTAPLTATLNNPFLTYPMFYSSMYHTNDLHYHSGEDEYDSEESTDESKRRMKKRGNYTKRACINCRAAHAACDSGRPCKRCVQLGKSATCMDAERKRTRKRGVEEVEHKKEQYFPSMADYIPLLGAVNTEVSSEPNTNKEAKKERRRIKRKEKQNPSKISPESLLSFNEDEVPDMEDSRNNCELDQTHIDIPLEYNNHTLFPSGECNSAGKRSSTSIALLPEVFYMEDMSDNTMPSYSLLNPSTGANCESQSNSTSQDSNEQRLTSNAIEVVKDNKDPELVKNLITEYVRQAEEVKHLKNLVRYLQQLVISPQVNPFVYNDLMKQYASQTTNNI